MSVRQVLSISAIEIVPSCGRTRCTFGSGRFAVIDRAERGGLVSRRPCRRLSSSFRQESQRAPRRAAPISKQPQGPWLAISWFIRMPLSLSPSRLVPNRLSLSSESQSMSVSLHCGNLPAQSYRIGRTDDRISASEGKSSRPVDAQSQNAWRWGTHHGVLARRPARFG